jgi:hypothetical protein
MDAKYKVGELVIINRDNEMIDAECLYRNGAKFTIKKGSNKNIWYSYIGENYYSQTILEDDAWNSGCPDSILKNVQNYRRSFSLSMSIVKRDLNSDMDAKNKKNAF